MVDAATSAINDRVALTYHTSRTLLDLPSSKRQRPHNRVVARTRPIQLSCDPRAAHSVIKSLVTKAESKLTSNLLHAALAAHMWAHDHKMKSWQGCIS